jgi:hypothetical protein
LIPVNAHADREDCGETAHAGHSGHLLRHRSTSVKTVGAGSTVRRQRHAVELSQGLEKDGAAN